MDKEEAKKKWQELLAEDHSTIKVEVGQIWGNRQGHTYPVIKVDETVVYAEDGFFGNIKNDMTPDWLANSDNKYSWRIVGWTDGRAWPPIQNQAAELAAPFATTEDFFRAVPQGNCPCNIPRHQCQYHG